MAVNILKRSFSINLAATVAQSIATVKNVRVVEQSRKNAEFNKAVAGGLSYKSQAELITKMIQEEKDSPFKDPDYIVTLETSLNTTNKMARFETIRNKYSDALNAYVEDKGSIDSTISVLQDSLSTTTDPDQRQQIQGWLSTERQKKMENTVNAINNRVTLAQNDHSFKLLDDSIKEITDKKARAALNDNEKEVSQWDTALFALNSSKSKLQIENGLNDLTLKINKDNPKSDAKLGYLNNEMAKADAVTPVTYDGVTYNSLKDFWAGKREAYIAGTDQMGSFFKEAQAEIKAETSRLASTNSYGQIPVARIQAVGNYFDTLINRDGFQNYVELIDQQKTANIDAAVTDLTTALYSQAQAVQQSYSGLNQDQRDAVGADAIIQKAVSDAETTITGLESKFGVQVTRPPTMNEQDQGKSVLTTVTDQLKTLPPPLAVSASSPANQAEIKRASDVYLTADTLAGTGKYVGQTADQIRTAAHNYANDIRSGKINNQEAPTTPTAPVTPAPTTPATPVPAVNAPVVKGPTVPVISKPATTPTTGVMYNGQSYTQEGADAQRKRDIAMGKMVS